MTVLSLKPGISSGPFLRISNNLSDVADAATSRTNLGVAIGSDVQAWDAQLDDIAGLLPTKGNVIIGDGSNWLSLGVGVDTEVLTADSVEASGIKWAAGGAGLPVVDTQTIVKGSVDPTKLMRFEVDGFTTGVTRVLTPPDQDFTLAGLEVANIFTAAQKIDVNAAAALLVEQNGVHDDTLVVDTGSGKVGIGTSTIPHGGIGSAKLAIEGVNASIEGPHLQFTTALDDYPVFQMLGWTHDNMSVSFDAYYDGSWKSADVGSNFQYFKFDDLFSWRYSSGNAQGSVISWSAGLTLGANGGVGINTDIIPVGGVGAAKLAITGPNASITGPHVQLTTSSSSFPVLQILGWGHDNISISFDAYFDGSWKSADAGSNFQILKFSDELSFNYASGIGLGGAISWNAGILLTSSGDVGIAASSPSARLHIVDEDAITAVITDITIVGHNSTGTPAANFGAGLKFELKTNTTPNEDAARIAAIWTDPTHAIKASALLFQTVLAGGSLTEQARITGTGFETSGERVVSTETHTATGTMSDTKERAIGNRATAFTLTLPTHKADKEIRAINVGAGAMTLSPTSGTVLGAATQVLAQRESLILLSDGTNWN